jgi:hypothetical protein
VAKHWTAVLDQQKRRVAPDFGTRLLCVRCSMDDQADRLQVSLSAPQNGWIELAVSTPEEEFREAVSFTPNDFLLELATALSLTMQGIDGVAVASCEPVTCEVTFVGVAGTNMTRLQVVRCPDWNRTGKSARVVLSFQATRLSIVLPFWRALRSLEGRVSATDYLEAMRRDSPSSCLQRLTQLVSDQRL